MVTWLNWLIDNSQYISPPKQSTDAYQQPDHTQRRIRSKSESNTALRKEVTTFYLQKYYVFAKYKYLVKVS